MKKALGAIVLTAGLLSNPTAAKNSQTLDQTPQQDIAGVSKSVCAQAKNILECRVQGDKIIVDGGLELSLKLFQAYQEYQTILAELRQKAESQDSDKKAERYMRFHDQYANAFAQMPTASKIDMLQILATGNDEGSKLKGQKLLDKASEYIAILDSGYTEENGVIVSKYNDFLTKFNSTSEQILSEILYSRLPKNVLEIVYADELLAKSERELAKSERELAKSERELAEAKEFALNAKIRRIESEKLLQALLALKKESQIVENK